MKNKRWLWLGDRKSCCFCWCILVSKNNFPYCDNESWRRKCLSSIMNSCQLWSNRIRPSSSHVDTTHFLDALLTAGRDAKLYHGRLWLGGVCFLHGLFTHSPVQDCSPQAFVPAADGCKPEQLSTSPESCGVSPALAQSLVLSNWDANSVLKKAVTLLHVSAVDLGGDWRV